MDTHLPRLDVLIYAHDGRGLGHASRSIGIGMALRRLFPGLRVLFVSGCRMSQELIGQASLDWLKLPSYETQVIAGKSRGIAGNSMYEDKELGVLRAQQLRQLVELYRPRVVLSDHTPQGKHRELIPAIEASSADTRWVLGVRGVVGSVAQVKSELARDLFNRHYSDLLWYGDSAVLGDEHLQQLWLYYGIEPKECGYVSRLQELRQTVNSPVPERDSLAATVAVPWLGEKTLPFLRELSEALAGLGAHHGQWSLFIDPGDSSSAAFIDQLFSRLDFCRLERPSGSRYVESLLRSQTAVIYGGYNSLMDVLSIGLPALVVMREMQDSEQQIHLQKLKDAAGAGLKAVEESKVTARDLKELLLAHLNCGQKVEYPVDLLGAERAAIRLNQMVVEG